MLLMALLDGPAHGYEVIRRLEERSGGQWRPSPGSVYPALQLLEDRANLERAFEVLSRRERIILFLRFYESVSQAEIAKRLGVSQMHVSRLQHKALEKLRGALGE